MVALPEASELVAFTPEARKTIKHIYEVTTTHLFDESNLLKRLLSNSTEENHNLGILTRNYHKMVYF